MKLINFSRKIREIKRYKIYFSKWIIFPNKKKIVKSEGTNLFFENNFYLKKNREIATGSNYSSKIEIIFKTKTIYDQRFKMKYRTHKFKVRRKMTDEEFEAYLDYLVDKAGKEAKAAKEATEATEATEAMEAKKPKNPKKAKKGKF